MRELLELLGPPEPRPADIDRFRGVMVGMAVGNALGVGVEGWPAEEIARRFGRVTDIPPAERDAPWDDDVAQAVLLAESILAGDTLDLDDLGRRFLGWFRESGRGIGLLTLSVMRELAAGVSAADAARRVWEQSGRRSAGNGAVMRCWPVALRWYLSSERLVAEARTSAVVTHFDPRCEWSTVASAGMAALALQDRPLAPQAMAAALERAGAPDAVGEALLEAHGAPLDRLHLDDRAAMGYTLKAMQVAAWCLEQPPDFEGVIEDVVNSGGDTDTNGAVAGALMGARLGSTAIPERWRASISREDDLVTLADGLWTIGQGSR